MCAQDLIYTEFFSQGDKVRSFSTRSAEHASCTYFAKLEVKINFIAFTTLVLCEVHYLYPQPRSKGLLGAGRRMGMRLPWPDVVSSRVLLLHVCYSSFDFLFRPVRFY